MKNVTVRLQAKAGASRGWQGFLGWLADTHPKLYNMARISDPDTMQMLEQQRHSGSMLSGLGLIAPPGTEADPWSFDSVVGSGPIPASPGSTIASPSTGGSAMDQFVAMISRAGAAILPLVQQQKVLNVQLKRAQAGQPPLDVGAYIDPNSGINLGLTPATQKTLLYAVGGIAAVYLVTRVLKHR